METLAWPSSSREHDGLQLGPAAPVGGRESVEVGLERSLFTRWNRHRGAVGPAQALAVLLRLDEIEHPDVKRLAALGQQDSLNRFENAGFAASGAGGGVGSHDYFDSPNGFMTIFSQTA